MRAVVQEQRGGTAGPAARRGRLWSLLWRWPPGRRAKRRSGQETEALYRISSAICATLDLGDVLRRIVTESVQLLAAQSASVILHDDATQEAELTTTYGQGTAVHATRYPLAGSLTGWVVEHRRPLRVPQLTPQDWPAVWQLAAQFGAVPTNLSVLLVPVWVQGTVAGSLEVVWQPHHEITEHDETLLAAIAGQAAIAITNARLYEEKERAVQAAQASEQRFKTFMDHSPALAILKDAAGRYVYCNAPWERQFRRPRAEWLGRTDSELWPAETAAQIREHDQTVLVTGTSLETLERAPTPEGTIQDWWVWKFPVHDARGQVLVGGLAIDITARTRLEAAFHEEAVVAMALARVGREMVSSLDTPVLLERLCQATTKVLECDHSHTALWQAEEQGYRTVAGYGDTPEQWEARRVVTVPRTALAHLLRRLEEEEVVELETEDAAPSVLTALLRQFEITATLCIGLWRGPDLIGIQTAGYRGRRGFRPRQLRIARGIAQLASLALNNAQLLEQAERASRLKSDFLAIISHELRTPLNTVLGYTDLLLEQAFGPLTAEQCDTLQVVQRAAHEEAELITAVLDVSRLEAGGPPVEESAVDITVLMAELAGDTERLWAKPGLQWEWRLAPPLPALQTDRTKLKVVLKNLLGNAAKFTEQGRISVEVHPREGGIEFAVSDTGIGIAPEMKSEIFEPFRQGDNSATRRYGGLGLGLYIVRRMVELLGGTIRVESAVGQGSTFRVWVPSGQTTGIA
jgi:PAS domain S-box-containing protein